MILAPGKIFGQISKMIAHNFIFPALSGILSTYDLTLTDAVGDDASLRRIPPFHQAGQTFRCVRVIHLRLQPCDKPKEGGCSLICQALLTPSSTAETRN